MNLGKRLESCFVDGYIDLRLLMEVCSVDFRNLSLDDVRFIEGECGELRQKFEDAEKVECFKTDGVFRVGFNERAYFSLGEIDLVKALTSKRIEKGDFSFKIERAKISKEILAGYIRDRKEWEK
ncbi:hypothetical protein [Acinetobacter pullicarnis]|uniref:hypothetical protein n=1 Tax=Acinetobacter pullicarnis TaxID=2576829 RepID=UPI001121F905|nr:hypothetical protein [Acinetobacter pullicarnis]